VPLTAVWRDDPCNRKNFVLVSVAQTRLIRIFTDISNFGSSPKFFLIICASGVLGPS
jgi:hypothetical protein